MSDEITEDQFEDLLLDLREAEASSVCAYEHGNFGDRDRYENEADAVMEKIMDIFTDLVAEIQGLRDALRPDQ